MLLLLNKKIPYKWGLFDVSNPSTFAELLTTTLYSIIMSTIGIFYGTSGGNTQEIANRIASKLGIHLRIPTHFAMR